MRLPSTENESVQESVLGESFDIFCCFGFLGGFDVSFLILIGALVVVVNASFFEFVLFMGLLVVLFVVYTLFRIFNFCFEGVCIVVTVVVTNLVVAISMTGFLCASLNDFCSLFFTFDS